MSGARAIAPSLKKLSAIGLSEDGIGGMPAGNADGDRKIPFRDGTVPDFVTALALAHEYTVGRAQHLPQKPVEAVPSGGGGFRFAQSRELKKERRRIDAR